MTQSEWTHSINHDTTTCQRCRIRSNIYSFGDKLPEYYEGKNLNHISSVSMTFFSKRLKPKAKFCLLL
jgi:hypothetical protein